MTGVFYSFIPHKKINGTLFYCFEYYTFLSKYIDIEFYIYNISNKDLEFIKNIFRDKYDSDLIDKIIPINSIKQLYKLDLVKSLFLDSRSLNNIFRFIKGNIICYSNDDTPIIRSRVKDIKFYGYYDYQERDTKELLKFNFNIFSKINSKFTNTAFVSSPRIKIDKIIPLLDIKENNIYLKDDLIHRKNLFEAFDTLYYYHHTLDTNNRMIPESFWYNKNVKVTFSIELKDSVYYSYYDIIKNGLNNYQISINDKMIKEFI